MGKYIAFMVLMQKFHDWSAVVGGLALPTP